MNPGTHHRLRQRYRWLGFLIGSACILLYGINLTVPAVPRVVNQLVLQLTGTVLSPWALGSINLLGLIVLLVVCWAGPALIFRWLILPRCPRCGSATRMTTASGVHYVCRSCSHCHDTGTMKHLAEAEGRSLEP